MLKLRTLAATALAIWTVYLPAGAQAQDHVGITIGVGPITGTDPAPAGDFVEPLFIVSAQRVMKRYFVVEGELSYWAHTTRFDYGPHDISGPNGVIGHSDHTTVLDDIKSWTLGVNLLLKSTTAVRLFGGGGVGFIMQDTEYSQEETGCVVPSQQLTCGRFVTARVRGPLPIFRALGGVEAPVKPRLALVAAIRAEVSTLEDRSHTMTALAGIRFSFP